MANMNFISAFLKDVLSYIDQVVGNYGLSVILFTLLIRLLLLPLDIKSKKSMKAMERVRPEQERLQKKYAQDKEKLNRKLTELYKQEGISPMSGCLPMLLQLPVMFCMFTAMRVVANEKTVEMLLGMMNGVEPVFDRFLWIKNVFQPDAFWATVIPRNETALAAIRAVNGSAWLTQENLDLVKTFLTSESYAPWLARYGADTIRYSAPLLMWTIQIPAEFNGLFILPVLSAVSSFAMNKLQPQTATTDEQNQTNKMMMYMWPVFSIWICASSTSAFAIYWTAANLIQIVQTWAVNLYFNRKEQQTTIKEVK